MSKKEKRDIYFVLNIITFSLICLIFVWERIQVVKIGYQLEQLQNCLRDLENDNKLLRIRLNNSQSLERVENIARSQLDLITPQPESIIYLPMPLVEEKQSTFYKIRTFFSGINNYLLRR